ncbi:MAG: damage-inducible protein CinA [Thermoplasmata archaeon]|nr:MAG: damage-inducible protein CinA [Thermoplasmata archaeon]
MQEEIARFLLERKWWIATAESCTGGLLAHTLTNIPGSSAYFKGGVVSYSNEVKMKVLGVKRETLEQYGAVSEQTAREMAEGVKNLMEVDVAVATTGIAGPGGGTPEKPVGLVYIGLATPEGVEVKRFLFNGDRLYNKEQFCNAALNMVLEYLGND